MFFSVEAHMEGDSSGAWEEEEEGVVSERKKGKAIRPAIKSTPIKYNQSNLNLLFPGL